jgi:hypothetical protein
MLIEMRDVRQVPGDRFRRWFADETLELVIWYEPQGSIHGFQVCYDPQGTPRALTWTEEKGFSHAKVDGGEESVFSNRTPILCAGGKYDTALLRNAFLASAGNLLEPERSFVEKKLAESTRMLRGIAVGGA